MKINYLLLSAAFLISISSTAQRTAYGDGLDDLNTVPTAVPFLLISPDSRAGGMGDVGVSTKPDANNIHWNSAKLAFAEGDGGLSISYTPWLSKLVDDINLAYLSYYQSLGRNQGFGLSMRYFSLGNITFTDESGNTIGSFNPNEFAIDGGYGLKLNDYLSGGVALRYIYSNLTGGQVVNGLQSRPGMSFAADLSMYFESEEFRLNDYDATLAVGFNVANIGNKISYTESGNRDFIPTNLRLGTTLNMEIDKFNTLSVSVEGYKLLVPTPPIYGVDSATQKDVILAGMDPNVSLVQGMIQSFYDAPGGTPEELDEIVWSTGLEYWYNQQFAFRLGYFHEAEEKGNRKYVTFGAGLRYNVFNIDFAYLVPAQAGVRSPLENTLRFSLIFDMGSFADQ